MTDSAHQYKRRVQCKHMDYETRQGKKPITKIRDGLPGKTQYDSR